MNNNTLPLHIRKFNERVKTMNQTHGANLSMTADEARALHAEIFALLTDTMEETQDNSVKMISIVKLDPGDNSL